MAALRAWAAPSSPRCTWSASCPRASPGRTWTCTPGTTTTARASPSAAKPRACAPLSPSCGAGPQNSAGSVYLGNVIETVASFQDPVEAQIVRALLESAGIDAIVADLNLVTLDWPMAQALGGVKLQVPQADVAEAKRLIAAYRAGELA